MGVLFFYDRIQTDNPVGLMRFLENQEMSIQ
jgi:hypothetical protein